MIDIFIQMQSDGSTKKTININNITHIVEKNANLFTISRPVHKSPAVPFTQLDKYTDTDLAHLLFNQTFVIESVPHGKWTVGVQLIDGSILGGANKIILYRTHLVSLFNIIQRLKTKQDGALLVALPTGSGKTFLQALWLHVLNLADFPAFFTMPDNLLEQFRKDMGRLLPDKIVNDILYLKDASADDFSNCLKNGTKSIVTPSGVFLDNFLNVNLPKNINKIFLSFDEQHKIAKFERHDVRLSILSAKYISLYLTATPSQKTYLKAGAKPVAMMTPLQKQQAKQGRLPTIKTINTMHYGELNFKFNLFKRPLIFILNEIIGWATKFAYPPVSSASKEAIDYLPYQISCLPGSNKRWDIQMPMATKMLWLVDDNESLVNLFLGTSKVYHNGVVQNFNPGKHVAELQLAGRNLSTMNKESIFEAQTKGLSENDSKKYLDKAKNGLFVQVKYNMFHYLVEYVLMDITSLNQIELNQLRKNDLSALVLIAKQFYTANQPRTKEYFYAKLESKIGKTASSEVSELLETIDKFLHRSRNFYSFSGYVDNDFLNNSPFYDIKSINDFSNNFLNYVEKYKIVAVMANMQDAETPICDSRPFSNMTHKKKSSYNNGALDIKAKKRKRSSIEQIVGMLGGNITDDYLQPKYLDEEITEEIIDNMFDLGMIGIYVSNKKAVGANFLGLQTVVTITENALVENANPFIQVQSYGRLRGLDETMHPTFINVLGRKVKTEFDLNLLTKNADYYPKYFRAQQIHNKNRLSILSKSLTNKIMNAFYEASTDGITVNYAQFKLQTLKLLTLTLRELNTSNNFDIDLSRAQLSEVITQTASSLDKEIYEIHNPYTMGLGVKIGSGILSGFFALYNLPSNIAHYRRIQKYAAKPDIFPADKIHLKIIKSVKLRDIFKVGLIIAEFSAWFTNIIDKITNRKEEDIIKKVFSLFKKYQTDPTLESIPGEFFALISEVLDNFNYIFDEILKYFTPILFHPEMTEVIKLLFDKLDKKDLLYLMQLKDPNKPDLDNRKSAAIKNFFKFISKIRNKNANMFKDSIKTFCFDFLISIFAELSKRNLNANTVNKIIKISNNIAKISPKTEQINNLTNSLHELTEILNNNQPTFFSSHFNPNLIRKINQIKTALGNMNIAPEDVDNLLNSLQELNQLLQDNNKQSFFQAIAEFEKVMIFKEMLTIPGIIFQTMSCSLKLYDKNIAALNLMSNFTENNGLHEYDAKISAELKKEPFCLPERKAATAIDMLRSTIKAAPILSNIKATASNHNTEALEYIKENVLKGVWWKLKYSAWKQSIIGFFKNVYFAIKYCINYTCSGIKNLAKKVYSYIFSNTNSKENHESKAKHEPQLSIIEYAKRVNKIKPISEKQAQNKQICPIDNIQPLLDEVSSLEGRSEPSIRAT